MIKKYYGFLSLRDKHLYNCKKIFRSVKIWIKGFFVDKTPDYDKISKCKKIIICAHPDDETIFFFSTLQKGTYVICMSNCGEKTRREEFFKALEYKETDGVMLNAPDVKYAQWMWSGLFWKSRFKKIKKSLNKDCEIYTHSIRGESGHNHHYAVGKFVSSYFKDFNVSYTAENAAKAKLLSEADFDVKMYILTDIYSSQIKMLSKWCPWFDGYMRADSFLK